MEDEEAPRDPLVLLADPLTGGTDWGRVRPLLESAFGLHELHLGALREPGEDAAGGTIAVELARALERSDEFPVHLLASGFAAGPALQLAEERPDLLRSLLLFDPIVPTARETPGRDLENFDPRFPRLRDDLASGQLDEAASLWTTLFGIREADLSAAEIGSLLAAGTAEWLREAGDTVSWRIPSGISEFLPPTLLLDTEGSPPFIQSSVEALSHRLPNVLHLRLTGADHLLPRSDPARVAGIVLTFCLERNVPSA